MKNLNVIGVVATLLLSGLLPGSTLAADSMMEGHVSLVPAELKWMDAPSIGPGAKLAILEGDLKEAVPFTFRVKLPANFKIAPHTHPLFERVTVISGTFYLGIGETFDASKARAYPPGGATMMPPGMPMFAYTKKGATVIQIHGTGPWGITYLNPAEDPRNMK